ncbi:MAG: CoA transferase [Syntrophobacteraceae bacterium]|jgi:crotonobetainyl-CoA:carnitine CoA-transferase CaiB-like acyl-CoA transferase
MRSPEELSAFISAQRREENFSGLPLKGLRVIDMSTVMAAPFAATLLGDYGAEVVKIENPSAPDTTRGWGVVEDMGIAPFWSVVGRNKLPITLNLRVAEGRQILMDLIPTADVLIENMRPGAMERLGFAKEVLFEANPGLIIGKISGYGLTGPYSNRPGFGTLAEAFSGFTFLNAQPNGPPTNAPMALADLIAGVHLAFAVMIALRTQTRGKHGAQLIDISLFEPLFGMLGPDFLSCYLTGECPQPKGNELSYVVPRNNYLTRDGKWVVLSAAVQKPFERLMECVGHPEMNEDPRFQSNAERIKDQNRKIINQVVSEWVGSLDLDKVLERCEQMGITIGPIATMRDVAEDPHYRERGSMVDIEDPLTGRTLKIPNIPFRLLGTPGRIRFPGLPLGSANDIVYRELLGYSEEKLREMAAGGAI